jgi:hypothetical protein
MATFLMLARDARETAEVWGSYSAEEAQRIIQQYMDWSRRMRESGHLTASNKLKGEGGRVVTGNGSAVAVKDGPYSETKEVVGGYWLLEAASYDEAVALAKTSPHLRFGSLEIREIDPIARPAS